MTADAITRPKRGRKPRFNDRRMEVLRTAARIFGEQGYRQATLEDIAGALNMTRPALYHYAESKEQLLQACADIAMESLGVALKDAGEQATGLEQIRVYFCEHLLFGCGDFGHAFLLMDEREMSEARRSDHADWLRWRNRRVEAMLRRGMDDGSLAQADPVTLRRLLFASFNAAARWVRSTTEPAIRKAADDLLDVLVRGLGPRIA